MAVLQSTNVQGALCVNGVAVGGGKDFKFCCFTGSTSFTPSQGLVDGGGIIDSNLVGGGGGGGSMGMLMQDTVPNYTARTKGTYLTQDCDGAGGGAFEHELNVITSTDACTVTVGSGGQSGSLQFNPASAPNAFTILACTDLACWFDTANATAGIGGGATSFAGKTACGGNGATTRICGSTECGPIGCSCIYSSTDQKNPWGASKFPTYNNGDIVVSCNNNAVQYKPYFRDRFHNLCGGWYDVGLEGATQNEYCGVKGVINETTNYCNYSNCSVINKNQPGGAGYGGVTHVSNIGTEVANGASFCVDVTTGSVLPTGYGNGGGSAAQYIRYTNPSVWCFHGKADGGAGADGIVVLKWQE
tara:strand:- start:1248 stop:2324 length:1077 start_codon:yes stop_codon:yes gene_type:complete